MNDPVVESLTRRLLDAVSLVGRARCDDPHAAVGDLFDSMGLVEFLFLVARDHGTTPEVIEDCVGRNFGTIAELATAMVKAGLIKTGDQGLPSREQEPTSTRKYNACWLGGTTVHLPQAVQAANEIDRLLQRPPGWLERRAGIKMRRCWQSEDAVAAAADAGKESLHRSAVRMEEVGALLVTSEAPPLLAGLAAGLHHHLGVRSDVPALEIGGACTGFLTALWLARTLLASLDNILIVSVEAPTRYFPLKPGTAGEAAALFGDGAAACLVSRQRRGNGFVPVADVTLAVDGSAGSLINIPYRPGHGVELSFQKMALAMLAVRAMAQAVHDMTQRNALAVRDLAAVVVHGGNGRMPAMLARQLELPPERVWSETARTGNLGSASLPVAWAAHEAITDAPVVWTAVGAGLTWGAALMGPTP
jgi:3-oxoacyl-[acyl-carrier-protein] synthase III